MSDPVGGREAEIAVVWKVIQGACDEALRIHKFGVAAVMVTRALRDHGWEIVRSSGSAAQNQDQERMKASADKALRAVQETAKREHARAQEMREVIEWLLPFATYPECICDKGTIGECDCNVEEAQRNYRPTIEKAQAFLSAARSPQDEDHEEADRV